MFYIYTNTLAENSVNLTIINTTSTATSPENYTKLSAFYLNASSEANISINVTIDYACNLNSTRVNPFYLRDNIWQKVPEAKTQSVCKITFPVPNGYEAGIFYYIPLAAPISIAVHPSSTPIPAYAIYALLIFILAILLLVYYMLKKKAHGKR